VRLSFLNPKGRTAINVTRLKRYGYETRNIIVDWTRPKSLVALVVLANGTPDDQIVGVLFYHLNGEQIIGVVKPTEKTHLSVLYELKTYLDLGFTKIMVLIDQEDLTLSDLFIRTENIIKEIGVNLDAKEDKDRVRLYECSLANKTFEIIIVVNGLSEICTRKHSIEDHLTKAAGIKVVENSKDSWENTNSNIRESIYRELKGKRKEIEALFPQQVFGFKRLMDEHEET